MLPTLYLGHVYTKGIIRTQYPRFLDGSKEKFIDYNLSLLEVKSYECQLEFPPAYFTRSIFKSCLENFPHSQPTLVILVVWDYSMWYLSTENVMGGDPKPSSCKPKAMGPWHLQK